jgi:hypothetical protein
MPFAPTTAAEISGPMPETLIRRQCLRRFQGEGVPLERQMSDADPSWSDIAKKGISWQNRISTGWSLSGTPMRTSAGGSMSSPT